MFNCPTCGSPFEKGEAVCKKCGYDLAGKFIYDPICPKCGRKYQAGSHLCEKDYTDLIPFEKFTPKCVRCQRAFTPDVEVCPYDGGAIRPIIGGPQEDEFGRIKEEVKKLAYYSEEEGYVYPKAPKGLRYSAYYYDSGKAGYFIIPLFILTVILVVSFPNSSGFFFFLYFILGVVGAITNILIKDTFQEGQSRGKKKYGLMIVDLETNLPCSKKKSIQRNITLAIPLMGWEELTAISNPKGQRMGDQFCNTQVIEVSQYAPELTRKAEDI